MSLEPRPSSSVDEERARQALSALETRAPDPDFRARLKREFVSGELATVAGRSGARRTIPLPRPWWRGPAAWVGVPVALAAAALLASALFLTPRWEVMSTTGDGVVLIDANPVPIGHREELSARLAAGRRVRVPEGASLTLAGAGRLAIQLDPGTDVTLPRAPGFLARVISAELRAGELRITTSDRFHGTRLAVITLAARVEITGTTLAVICAPEGTCVCVFDGMVLVGRKAGPMTEVEHGHRGFVYDDAREPIVDSIRPDELILLGAFRERGRSMLAGRR